MPIRVKRMLEPVVILNLAYIALLGSTFTRQLVWLRTMLVLAAIAFIAYGSIESIRSMVIWNILIGSMHLFRIARDYRQQRSVGLTDAERVLRDEFFPGLGDFDFNLLWCMGSRRDYAADELLIGKESQPDTVSLIMDGTAVIERDGVVTRGIRRGGLLGEMSFVSGQAADVDVRARGHVVVQQWEQRQLASMDQVHPASARAFRSLMSRDLVAKARTSR